MPLDVIVTDHSVSEGEGGPPFIVVIDAAYFVFLRVMLSDCASTVGSTVGLNSGNGLCI